MRKTAVALAMLATAAGAQDIEDAAHRADRLATQSLNRRSPNGYAPAHGAVSSDSQRAYQHAQEDYARRLAAWRRRVAACEAGDYEACQ